MYEIPQGLACEYCNTGEHLVLLDDLMDNCACGCGHIVCAECGQDAAVVS